MNTNKPTYEELEKRLTEEEVQRQVAFLDSVMEQSLFAMWISDAKGTVIRTNSALRRIVNLTDEQILGKYNVLRDDNLTEQGVMNQVRAVFEEQKPAKFTIPWVGTKAGNAIFERAPALWIDVSIFPIVDTEGRLTNTVCHWIDITERKLKENELRMSEMKYRDLVENMVEVIFALDTMGRVISVNGAVRAMLGYEPEEIVGRHFTEWVRPDQMSIILSVFGRVLAGQTIIDESIFVGKDGKEHHVEFHATRILQNRQVIGVQGGLRDISEQKRAADALHKTEQKYKMLFDEAMDAIFVADARTGILLDCNRAATELTGWRKSELIGRPRAMLHPPQEDEGELTKTFRLHLKDPNGKTLETQVVTKNGQIKDVAIRARLIEIGSKTILMSVFRDVTNRKRVEADLRRSDKRFKQVVENAGDWVWEVDSDGLYTYVSPVVDNILGYKPKDIVGKKYFYDFFRRDVKEDLKKAALEAFTKRENFYGFINPVVHKNGGTVVVETYGSPIIDEKGHFCGYRGVDRDITERTRREGELRKLNADLVLASRRAGTAEVATDVLHNVGNVLNSINISARSIEDKVMNSKAEKLKKVVDLFSEHTGDLGTFLKEDARGKHIPVYLTGVAKYILEEHKAISEKLQSLMKNVEHVKQVIQAQQNYARSGGAVASANIDEVIEDAVDINHAALKKYGIDLRYELADLPRIHMDKQRVLQILVNLITNAKQALAKSEQTQKVLTIRSYEHHGDFVRIEVADNGVGISKENMPKMFTHGFTTKKNGHGFGLHSSALAAREMGGSLTVESDGPGCGATFTLELPFKRAEVKQ